MSSPEPKQQVKEYWEQHPCGAADAPVTAGTDEFFESTEVTRATRDDFMDGIIHFGRYRSKSVLEVGCGIGTDLSRFARAGARTFGVDITHRGAQLSRDRLVAESLPGEVIIGDAEHLPFGSNTFDLVYSWGVIHHTPDTRRAAAEMMRVCRPGGQIITMVYNRRSLVAAQAWLVYGLARGRPFSPASRLIAEKLESPGTKVFTRQEAHLLFRTLDERSVRTVVTSWDLRLGRRRFLPRILRSVVPSRFGWFMVIQGVKS